MGGGISTAGASAAVLKKLADYHFEAEQYQDAADLYSIALNSSIEDIQDISVATLYSNRSATYEKLGQFSEALKDAMMTIDLAPQWSKGYIRASKALASFPERLNEAVEYIEKAIALISVVDVLQLKQLTDLRSSIVRGGGFAFKGAGCTYTWGSGSFGQLGNNDRKDKSFPTLVDSLRGRYVTIAACGATHSVAVLNSGEVLCWGGNSIGQCGIISREEHVLVPSLVPQLLGLQIVAVACGAAHSLAVSIDGRVFSWGAGANGQLGHGSVQNLNQPKPIQDIHQADAIACGIAHSMILCKNGEVFSFGLNSFGQLGLGNISTAVVSPTRVPLEMYNSPEISHIACGGGHSLLVDSRGILFATGSNSCGQLGLSHLADSTVFQEVTAFVETEIAFVTCGEEYSIALTRARKVYTWGLGSFLLLDYILT